MTTPRDEMEKANGSPLKHEEPVDNLHNEAMWAEVKARYMKETPTKGDALLNEIRCVREGMELFAKLPQSKGVGGRGDADAPRYVIVDFLGVGGAGIVFKAWDTTLRTYRALKIARPIEGKEDLIAGLLSEEISRLQEVSHPNVIAMFDAGHLESSGGAIPFYTMTYLRGALPADKYFAKACEVLVQPTPVGALDGIARKPTPTDAAEEAVRRLLEFAGGLLAGVVHLHQAGLVHLDLKPSNVFVAEDGFAVVADLGGARQLHGNPSDPVLITCTTGYAHPDLLGLTALSSGGDSNRRRGKPKRSELRVAFDLFATGKTLLEIIRLFDLANPKALPTYTRKYLQLQGARLLDGSTGPTERPLGLTEASLKAIKYKESSDALRDFSKLVGKVNPLNEIPELSPTNDRVIQVIRGQKTSLTPRLQRLLDEPLLRRLGTVSQLGLVENVPRLVEVQVMPHGFTPQRKCWT